ncbi:class I SAM-dependent methyltransferase [Streptomyces armeniacus]|uniref:Class I SAM-dependent methyltransferase n=1 Tax=Streptomyces armeniacus TaxID=83291 RepID=A0A345XLQ1_9ACTN|nr:class I SAM-dependent methyltransferase [Streptomyces armeniacus]AXK32567.1 class I SAM-dependent methyltransferase [Streptomyces armeniacus]
MSGAPDPEQEHAVDAVDAVDADEVSRRLAAESAVDGASPTGWFERLYAAAAHGEAEVPWDRGAPHALLTEWARRRAAGGAADRTPAAPESGREPRALVIGAGLGDDAEFIAGLGYDTVAFDVAPTAVREAERRFPDSAVHYRTADLLDPPPEWHRAFPFVFESQTVQALPVAYRRQAVARVRDLVAPGGTLLVIAFAGEPGDEPDEGPPWPLTRADIDAFAADGLRAVRVEEVRDPEQPEVRRWRAEFSRAGVDGADGAARG